jgi:hypothetical protein
VECIHQVFRRITFKQGCDGKVCIAVCGVVLTADGGFEVIASLYAINREGTLNITA